MTVYFQRIFAILERWNNNQVTPSLSKPHELSYRSNTFGGNWKNPGGCLSRNIVVQKGSYCPEFKPDGDKFYRKWQDWLLLFWPRIHRQS